MFEGCACKTIVINLFYQNIFFADYKNPRKNHKEIPCPYGQGISL